MAILGLTTAESFSSDRFKNIRRSVFYFYPNGAAPLTGLISLLKEEVTNDPEYKWFEKRLAEQRTTTVAISSTIAIYDTSITVAAQKVTAATIAAGNVTFTADTQYAIKVAASPENVFRIGHIIRMAMTDTGGKKQEVLGRVNAINTASDTPANVLGFIATRTVTTAVDYDLAANIGIEVLAVGSAFAEGGLDISSGIYTQPINPYNLCQISRAPFSITGTALKTSLKYDETGAYKDQAKDASVAYMIELEKNYFFGERNLYSSGGQIVRTMGGLLWYLRQWEAGTNYGVTASTSDSDDNKRIIDNAGGTISDKTYNSYLERLFRVTNNKSNEKLVLCGSGFLSVINQMYMGRVCLDASLPFTDTYGMDVVKHKTPFGTVYYKTHPLMSQNAILRNNAFFLDMQNFVYRYLDGRDVALLKNRQANDADYRKDEWLGETGLEIRFPESHMYLQNVQDFVP